jgi:hypothetical protein
MAHPVPVCGQARSALCRIRFALPCRLCMTRCVPDRVRRSGWSGVRVDVALEESLPELDGARPPVSRDQLQVSKLSQKGCGGMKPCVNGAICRAMWRSSGSDQ